MLKCKRYSKNRVMKHKNHQGVSSTSLKKKSVKEFSSWNKTIIIQFYQALYLKQILSRLSCTSAT